MQRKELVTKGNKRYLANLPQFHSVISGIFAPGFLSESGARFNLAVYFLRFTAFSTLFIVMNGMLTGLSQAYKDFVPYMVSAPMQNIIILLFIVLAYFAFPHQSIFLLALGTISGAAVFV